MFGDDDALSLGECSGDFQEMWQSLAAFQAAWIYVSA